MVSLIATDATNNNAQTGVMLARTPSRNDSLTHVERYHLEQREITQEVAWVARVSQGQSHSRARYSQMQMDSRGFSWVTHLEAESQERLQPLQLTITRILNEKHREKVGAEEPQRDTPTLKPLFGKNPVKGKFSLRDLQRKSEPKSFFGALLN